MSVTPGLAGLVLAGGRSSRFGAEKAVQVLSGRTLLEWALATLDDVSAHVAVSAAPHSAAEKLALSLGRQVLADDPGHPMGPLAGIAAALAWAANLGLTHLATLPCDTPLVTPAQIRALGAVGYAETPDGPQALCAIWPTSAFGALADELASGHHPAVRTALAAAGIPAVRFADAAPFANINAPADLAALARQLSK